MKLLLLLLALPMIGFGQNVNIPDAIFKAYLVNNTAINTNGDNEIQVSEASVFNSYIVVQTLNITDLTGIEAFVSLTVLYCNNNQLTSLDVSTCTALTYLHCYNNQLTSLDVSSCTALTYLDCNDNQLTSLDVTSCTALTFLDCYNNQLTSLDVSSCTALTYLDCEGNQLTSLDASGCTALTDLGCEGNQLTSLDVSTCTALTYLHCYNNQLTSLDVSSSTAIGALYCYDNQLTSLDVSTCTALAFLDCHNNQLTSLDVKNGNNINMPVLFDPLFGYSPAFLAYNNPNLSCIEVDNVAWSQENWANNIDSTAYFSENCSGAGISDINESIALMFYPNPTTGTLYLSDPANISLSDLSGKLLLEEKNTNQLDLSALPAGMYFLHFGENNLHTYKVIKE